MRLKIMGLADFFLSHIRPVFKYVILVFTLYLTLERILLWSLLEPFYYNKIRLVLKLFTSSPIPVTVDRLGITHGIALFTLFASLLLLPIKNKYVRQSKFWLASLPLLGILITSVVSRFWSVTVEVTDTRLLALAAVAAGAAYSVLEFDKQRLIWFLEAFAGLVILGCLLAVYKHPHVAIMSMEIQGANPGAWLGLFWWKIYLGEVMVFAAILFLFQLSNIKKQPWLISALSFLFYALSLFLLVKSQSVTESIALLAIHVILVLAILYLRWGHRLKPIHGWIFIAVCLCVPLAIWLGRGILLEFVGRSSDLTGRMPLWAALVQPIKQRLLTGYGFGGAFWKNPAYRNMVWSVLTWRPPHAHNGYIEALLDTGIFGFVFWMLFFIQITYLSVRHFTRERALPALIFLALLVEVVISNLADAQMGSYETFAWFILVMAFISLLRDSLDKQPPVPVASSKT